MIRPSPQPVVYNRLQVRILDAGRLLEVFALVAMSLVAVVSYHPYGYLVAVPLLVVAYILVPRERSVPATREDARWQVLSNLQTEGFRLRAAHIEARGAPFTLERSHRVWQSEREIVRFIDRSQSQLKPFPEIAFIYKFRTRQATVAGELDCCLEGLERMRRLCRLSETLNLPM